MAADKNSGWGQALAMGFETAVGVALGYFIGHWLDKKFGWTPWGAFIGAMLGLIAGAYLLIKEVNRMDKK